MAHWFNKQSRILRFLLMLIPVVNWVIEIVIRWSAAIETRRLGYFVVAFIVTFLGLVVGWLDMIWILLTGHMLFAKA